MTSEFRATCKKRASLDVATSSNPAQEGNHRKRRRNRTTLSCFNCHTSKRMCDRKRPCGRCTQFGLTGLCIYEVDDPSQRSDTPDESLQLRLRVAELEGVVRELKNKPHPRWVKSKPSPADEFRKRQACSKSRVTLKDSTRGPQHRSDKSRSPLTANSNADTNKDSPEVQALGLTNGTVQTDHFQSSFLPPSTGNLETLSNLPCSPPSGLSTQFLVAAKDEYAQFPVVVAGDQQLINDVDLASLFMPCSDLLICDEGTGHACSDGMLRTTTHGQHIGPCLNKYSHGHLLESHCGCLNETVSYNVMLELSLRLRKAVDILSHSANHRFSMGTGCPLNQRIAELDIFATAVLGSIMTSPNDFGLVCSRANTTPGGLTAIPPAFSPNDSMSTILCIPSSVPASGDDESFMTWEPSRRV